MSIMNLSAVIISILGVVFSIFTSIMNIYLLLIYRRKKDDILIFYYRFALDVLIGFTITVFLSFVIIYALFTEDLLGYHNLIVYFAVPASAIGAVRSIITLAISVERLMATYTPLFFHNYRQLFSPVLIMTVAVLFGLTEPSVLFGFCNYTLSIQRSCAALGCAVNHCFFIYWATHKMVVFAFIFSFSILVCLKLFVLNRSNGHESVQLSRINRLALIDAGIICFFDFLPNIVASQFSSHPFFSFQNIGPYGAVSKIFGCAIEAFLVFRTLSRQNALHESETTFKTKIRRCRF
ncbi:hypothetical protein CRE_18994 [Caenorhabditis remanei]|uniref:Serpentine Receptor, class BC (Class B-like) n=1 Tax=Caenorhabditis remanei TaxID=31234 RepID=E3LL08_CAERE|nr:hypothetical protein CRE_18994 [Caenorhabditis remanei]